MALRRRPGGVIGVDLHQNPVEQVQPTMNVTDRVNPQAGCHGRYELGNALS